MFGFVGKLFSRSIFSACQIFELGPQSKCWRTEIFLTGIEKSQWVGILKFYSLQSKNCGDERVQCSFPMEMKFQGIFLTGDEFSANFSSR